MTPADALTAELRNRGLGAEPAGDRVRVSVAGLPLTPLPVTTATQAETTPVWSWRTGGRGWPHPRDDPAGAARQIAASRKPPPT